MSRGRISNWSGTASCTPARLVRPESLDALRALLAQARAARRPVRVIGARHSPGDVFCTDGDLIDLANFNRIVGLDASKGILEVEGGTRLNQLHGYLNARGFALANLGSISEQSIAGAIATGTHGTGIRFAPLHDDVTGLDVLLADGTVRTIEGEREPELLNAFRVSLGALGVVVRVRLRVVPSFALDATIENHPLDRALRDLPDDLRKHDHFKLLVYPHTGLAKKWIARRTAPSGELDHDGRPKWSERLVHYHLLEPLVRFAGGHPALLAPLHRAYYQLANRHTVSYRGLSHHVFNFDCLFQQHVNEWSVPLEVAASTVRSLDELITARGFAAHFPIEVRFARADEAWLSPTFRRDACFIGIIQYRPYGHDFPRAEFWRAYEELMRAHAGRPHWAKRFDAEPAYLRQVFPRLDDFLALRRELDPDGLFVNEYLRRHFGPGLGVAPAAEVA